MGHRQREGMEKYVPTKEGTDLGNKILRWFLIGTAALTIPAIGVVMLFHTW